VTQPLTQPPETARRMARILPLAGFALAIGFCAFALWTGGRDLPAINWADKSLWAWLGAALALYILSQVLAARAWAGTLAIFSIRLPQHRAETQLLVAQIGKYIPGNVAHFLGRYALARTDGVAALPFSLALLVEIGIVLSASAVLLIGFLIAAPDLVGRLLPPGSGLSQEMLSRAIVLGLALAIGACLWILWARLRRASGAATVVLSRAWLPVVLHLVNFAILGLSLACVLQALEPDRGVGLLLPVAVFILAWTVGFLTPGSPGGLGVREGLVVLGLGLMIGNGPALAVALMHRGVSIAGDLACLALGLVLRKGGGAGPSSRPDAES
jgi:hypothetical protein